MNSKKLRHLMREHGLQPKRRRRYVITTVSNHAEPIYPHLAKQVVPDQPNQLWVADLYLCRHPPAASSTSLPFLMPARARSPAMPSVGPWTPELLSLR